MTTTEKVVQLKSQGFSENEIIKRLQGEGTSPREISDALNQSKIKEAVNGINENGENMEPSMMGTQISGYNDDTYQAKVPKPQSSEEYVPQQANYSQDQNYAEQNYSQNYATQSYPQQYAPEETYQGYVQGSENSADTMIEISEQVFSEKIKKFQKQLLEIVEFKAIYQAKLDGIEERLRRIEKMFDQLQISIIEKVGSYGKNLDNLKNEVEMVEDSFSKLTNKSPQNLEQEKSKKKIIKK